MFFSTEIIKRRKKEKGMTGREKEKSEHGKKEAHRRAQEKKVTAATSFE